MFNSKFISVGLLSIVLILVFWGLYGNDLGNPMSAKEQVVRYKLELENSTNLPVKNARVRVFAPVDSIGWQRTLEIKSDRDFDLKSDSYGNQMLDFALSEVAPYSKQYITVTALISFDKKNAESYKKFPNNTFLQSEKYIDKNNLKISMLASSLSESSKSQELIDVAQETHKWVSKNMVYSSYEKKDLGAVYAINNLRGDCTEYMYLNAAIMRAQGIANIPVSGFYIGNTNGMLSAVNYHNWNYFDTGSEWRLSDSQGNNFDDKQSEYVVFRVIAKDEIQTLSNTHRFSISDERLKVKLI